ncbi:MAG: YbjN domain-containing protein [Pseudomonadota bacterium]
MSIVAREDVDFVSSPIDLVEDLAEMRSWDVDRLGEDQIAMAVEGAWKTYSLSLAWYEPGETLRMVCTYPMQCAEARTGELLKAVDAANDRSWLGGFNFWKDQELMAYRYGLTLSGGAAATHEQVEHILHEAVENCERYYPAFQLVAHQGATVETALAAALLEFAGRA